MILFADRVMSMIHTVAGMLARLQII